MANRLINKSFNCNHMTSEGHQYLEKILNRYKLDESEVNRIKSQRMYIEG